MGVLTTTKKSDALVKKSDGIVDVFRSTMVKLQDVNQEIINEDKRLVEQQEQLRLEREAIAQSKAQNEKIIGKIQAFFE